MKTGELLQAILPKERIKTRLIDLVSYASDAGFYYLRPKAVVQPVTEEEIISLFTFSHQHEIPLTFRTGGTSLSGQSISDGILVDLSQYWNKIQIEQNGLEVRLQPGITGGMANAYLKKYRRKIGPDPSSIDAAMIGGILSNNSSGMCCGVINNSYHTTKYIRFILPDGKQYSTEQQPDYTRFEKECPDIFNTIRTLREELIANRELYDRVRKKYQTKNTVGYSLNALIDYEHPLDIFAHLLIGAEGTLAFIAEVVMETIPDYPCKATALLYFGNIYDACRAIIPLSVSGAQAVELMDRASLRSIENMKGVPERLRTLPSGASALLVEYQADTEAQLKQQMDSFMPMAKTLALLEDVKFTRDSTEQAFLWKLRKGMFPAVGAVRASGTAVILEDIAFPVHQLGDAILDLQLLFEKHAYANAIIFGHAKDGNIHFVITQTFNTQDEVDRYDFFMRDVVELVVKKYDGALKAEHGTGRNMAPFVETEWGSEAYRIMARLKKCIDPENLLNPGVIINDNKNAHLCDLKMLPAVEQEVDRCIECGYCEHVCPSRNITLTPRRRIVVRREMAMMKKRGETKAFKDLAKEYQYDGLDTCAVDGLCASACPVDINTGDLVKRLRRENHHSFANKIAILIAKNFGTTVSVVRLALRTGHFANHVAGKSFMGKFTGGIKKIIPSFPLWSNQLLVPEKLKTKQSSNRHPKATVFNHSVVYLPSCISNMMGGLADKKNIYETFLSVSAKAGIGIVIPHSAGSSCCGQLFSSKGFSAAHAVMCNKTIEKLWNTTQEGKFPVVLDVSSCTYTLQHCRPVLNTVNQVRFDKLNIIDSIDYLHDYILPLIHVKEKKTSIVLHPVCSLEKMGLQKKLQYVAAQFANVVNVPLHAGCCGMAGDRGFLFPELTASATAPEAEEVKHQAFNGYYSSARTCELALSGATGASYESLLYLADECI